MRHIRLLDRAMKDSFWTQARMEYLAEKWGLGWSSGMIARELGCKRGAVSGKVSRLGLPKRETCMTTNGWGMGNKNARRDRRPRARPATENLNRSAPVNRGQSNFVNHTRKTKAELHEELRQAVLNTGGHE